MKGTGVVEVAFFVCVWVVFETGNIVADEHLVQCDSREARKLRLHNIVPVYYTCPILFLYDAYIIPISPI